LGPTCILLARRLGPNPTRDWGHTKARNGFSIPEGGGHKMYFQFWFAPRSKNWRTGYSGAKTAKQAQDLQETWGIPEATNSCPVPLQWPLLTVHDPCDSYPWGNLLLLRGFAGIPHNLLHIPDIEQIPRYWQNGQGTQRPKLAISPPRPMTCRYQREGQVEATCQESGVGGCCTGCPAAASAVTGWTGGGRGRSAHRRWCRTGGPRRAHSAGPVHCGR